MVMNAILSFYRSICECLSIRLVIIVSIQFVCLSYYTNISTIYILCHVLNILGVQINKPLVEKPVDSDDHNIHIYYPMSAGGGSKRLFRKIKDRSSEFYPGVHELRTEGSYIYEEFVYTQGNGRQ